MDYLGEAIALTIDTIILGTCIKQYIKSKKAMSMIQVSSLEINPRILL